MPESAGKEWYKILLLFFTRLCPKYSTTTRFNYFSPKMTVGSVKKKTTRDISI
jgi:hypothetical protein